MPWNVNVASHFRSARLARSFVPSVKSVVETDRDLKAALQTHPMRRALRPSVKSVKTIAMKPLALLAMLVLGVAARAASLNAPPTDVIMLDHAKVDDSFAKGLPYCSIPATRSRRAAA